MNDFFNIENVNFKSRDGFTRKFTFASVIGDSHSVVIIHEPSNVKNGVSFMVGKTGGGIYYVSLIEEAIMLRPRFPLLGELEILYKEALEKGLSKTKVEWLILGLTYLGEKHKF